MTTPTENPCIAYINSHHRLEEYLGKDFEEAREEVISDGNYSWTTMVILAIEKRVEAARERTD